MSSNSESKTSAIDLVTTAMPVDHSELHHQTELSEMGDDEFMDLFEPVKPSLGIRLYRLLCFIFFGGIIKLILLGIVFVSFYALAHALSPFRYFFRTQRAFKAWAWKIVSPLVRVGLFAMGIWRIRVIGEPDPNTRTFVSNHMSLLETVIILSHFETSFLAADNLRTNAFVAAASLIFDYVFVDRSSRGNVSDMLHKIANDPSLLPVFVFPEGKVENGDAILSFRSGAFRADTTLQPLAIRYRQWLCPRSMATIAWNEWCFKRYLYELLSIPFITVEVTCLQAFDWKGRNKTPPERALEAQLAIANSLGARAISRSNRDYFDLYEARQGKKFA